MRSARWIFLRTYLLIALLVLVTGISLESLLERRAVDAILEREAAALLGSFRLAENQLPELASAGEASTERAIAQQLQLPALLHPLTDFSNLAAGFIALQNYQTLYLYNENDRPIFYRRLQGSDWVLAIGPLPDDKLDSNHWIVPLFYSLLALAVYLWIRPLSRDLENLQQASRAFGGQDFSNRVAVPQRSWLAPLGEAFNAMAVRIQRLLQSHRDLTHAVSHELRTPLARLRFSLEMLESASEQDRLRHSQSMRTDIEELNTLVEEMLGYAELDQENLTPQLQPVAITPWLRGYLQNHKHSSYRVQLQLGQLPDAGVTVQVDERMLGRALDNLVGNAQRYASSSIDISATVTDSHCHLHVQDDGPGIPESKRQAVLAAFTRLDADKGANKSGFGLGLAIVKRIMDLHSGEVIISQSDSGGADFCLCWPR